MKKSLSIAILGTAFIVWLTGCANGPKLARELAKDPATVSFSVQLVTPWGQQNVSFARSGTNNAANAAGGAASVNGAKL
jgi:hypothetical protein